MRKQNECINSQLDVINDLKQVHLSQEEKPEERKLIVDKDKFHVINNKRIAKNTLMLYIRMVIITLVSLYTSRLVLEFIGIEDYGIYSAVGGVVMMFGFVNSAMSNATQRFLSFELGKNNSSELSKVFSISIIIHLFIAFLILLLAESIGLWFVNYKMSIPANRLFALNFVYQFSIMTLIVNIVSVPYNAMIISYEKMSVFAYISILEVALKLGLVYILLLTTNDKLIVYSILMFMAALIIRIVYQIYCRIKIPSTKFCYRWDKPLIKELLAYASWNLFGSIAYVAKSQGVNVILNIYWGVFVNASYAIANQISNAVLTMISNFIVVINPPIVKSYASGNINAANNLLFIGMRYSFFLTSCLIFPLILNSESILQIWLGQVPKYSVLFTQLSLIVLLIESVIHPLASYIQATGRVKVYQSIIGTLLFSILPLSFFALQIFETPFIVMYVTIIITFVSVIIRFIILYSYLKFTKEDIIALLKPIIAISIVNIALCYYYHVNILDISLFNVILTSSVSILITFGMFCIFGMNLSERALVLNKIRRKAY